MEGIQYPLPFRTFDLLDAAANAVGAALGALAWLAGAGLRRDAG
jgi:VanZ family protein